LRQLLMMGEGRGRDRWSHTSLICAILANASRDPKRTPRAFRPSDFDPYARADRRRVADKEDLSVLREALEGQKDFSGKSP